MDQGEITINRAAAFLPMDDVEAGELPCVTVGGAQVYVYVENGVLRVSVDLDGAEAPLRRADNVIPLHVTVQGDEVFTAP